MARSVTFQFRHQGQGWTEAWFVDDAEPVGGIGPEIIAVAQERIKLLPHGVFLTHAVLREVNATGAARKYKIGNPRALPAGGEIDTAWNSVRVTATAGEGLYKRLIWLRGVRDDWLQFDIRGAPLIAQALRDQVLNYVNKLAERAWQTKVVARNLGVNPRRDVTGLATHLSGLVQVTSPFHGLSLGDMVNIRRVIGRNLNQVFPGRLSVNGVWQVCARLDANNFLIPLPVETLRGDPEWDKNGYTQKTTPLYVPLDTLDKDGLELVPGVRKTGRGVNVKKGRKGSSFRTYT